MAAHPLDVPGVPVAAIWHHRFENDPGHRWFRELVCEKLAPHFLANG